MRAEEPKQLSTLRREGNSAGQSKSASAKRPPVQDDTRRPPYRNGEAAGRCVSSGAAPPLHNRQLPEPPQEHPQKERKIEKIAPRPPPVSGPRSPPARAAATPSARKPPQPQ